MLSVKEDVNLCNFPSSNETIPVSWSSGFFTWCQKMCWNHLTNLRVNHDENRSWFEQKWRDNKSECGFRGSPDEPQVSLSLPIRDRFPIFGRSSQSWRERRSSVFGSASRLTIDCWITASSGAQGQHSRCLYCYKCTDYIPSKVAESQVQFRVGHSIFGLQNCSSNTNLWKR